VRHPWGHEIATNTLKTRPIIAALAVVVTCLLASCATSERYLDPRTATTEADTAARPSTATAPPAAAHASAVPIAPTSAPRAQQKTPAPTVTITVTQPAPSATSVVQAGPTAAEIVVNTELRRSLTIERQADNDRLALINRDMPAENYFLSVATSFEDHLGVAKITAVISEYNGELTSLGARVTEINAELSALAD
jgi:hypothetical protein